MKTVIKTALVKILSKALTAIENYLYKKSNDANEADSITQAGNAFNLNSPENTFFKNGFIKSDFKCGQVQYDLEIELSPNH